MVRGKVTSTRIIEELGSEADRFDRQALEVFITELLRFTPRLGLVSRKAPDKVILGLLRLSIELRDFIVDKSSLNSSGEKLRIVDIGSGGGFPGVAWRILDERMEVTLIERKQRKALFLKRLSYVLGLEGLDVLDMDAGDAAREDACRGQFDLAVTIAVAHPHEIGKVAGRFLKPSGLFCTVRGGKEKVYPGEIAGNLKIIAASVLEDRTFLLYKKASEGRLDGGW